MAPVHQGQAPKREVNSSEWEGVEVCALTPNPYAPLEVPAQEAQNAEEDGLAEIAAVAGAANGDEPGRKARQPAQPGEARRQTSGRRAKKEDPRAKLSEAQNAGVIDPALATGALGTGSLEQGSGLARGATQAAPQSMSMDEQANIAVANADTTQMQAGAQEQACVAKAHASLAQMQAEASVQASVAKAANAEIARQQASAELTVEAGEELDGLLAYMTMPT